MKTNSVVPLCAAIIVSLTGCVSNPNSPSAAGALSRSPAQEGYLRVFTATQTADADFHAYFELHSG